MNLKTEPQNSRFDVLKWILSIALLLGGVGANFYYSHEPLSIRLIAWIVLVAVASGVIFQTAKGRTFLSFTREARMELRKVVWPNRQETIQTTLVVIGMVFVMVLILWGVDAFLMWSIAVLTGQRG